MPNIRWLLTIITRIHRFIFVNTGGRLGSKLLWMNMLLLVNVGRKSGREFQTPLLYIEDAGRFIVAASNAGDPRDPTWWLNLQARPEAAVRIGRERIAVRWWKAAGAEDADLWSKLTESYAFFPQYREKAGREVPIIILERSQN